MLPRLLVTKLILLRSIQDPTFFKGGGGCQLDNYTIKSNYNNPDGKAACHFSIARSKVYISGNVGKTFKEDNGTPIQKCCKRIPGELKDKGSS